MPAPTLASCRLSRRDAESHLTAAGERVASAWLDTLAAGEGTLRTDSRMVAAGDIFLAYQGVAGDGHQHLGAAIAAGAALLVVERADAVPNGCAVPWIAVRSGRRAWAFLASAAFGEPQRALKMIGVTGTNGKTSTVWMTMHLATAMGVPTVGIGTLGAYFGSEHVDTGHTTPDPNVLYALLAMARDRGYRAVVMEVSSHAIAQEKVAPLRFAAAAFTSFTRDHLDFHPTMEHYLETKMRLFGELAKPAMASAFAASVATQLAPGALPTSAAIYGEGAEAAAATLQRKGVTFSRDAESFSGTDLRLGTERGRVPYFATHALENFSAAWILAGAIAGREAPASLWASLPPVPGRLEQIAVAGTPGVVVDYAHTPDAVAKTLQVLRAMCRGRLVIVFGCGGDRDPGKRPQMGQLAERYADMVYVTSDNPRTESPEAIAEDILRGLTRPAEVVVDTNRASAIERAIWESAPEDLVLVAGKGHETYQIIGRQVLPFDDREVARRVLAQRKAAQC